MHQNETPRQVLHTPCIADSSRIEIKKKKKISGVQHNNKSNENQYNFDIANEN